MFGCSRRHRLTDGSSRLEVGAKTDESQLANASEVCSALQCNYCSAAQLSSGVIRATPESRERRDCAQRAGAGVGDV